MPHRDREARNAYSREYKRRMRADPVRRQRELQAERALYARKKDQIAPAIKAKNARYRASHRAELSERERMRHACMGPDARKHACETRNAWRKRKRASDEGWRAKQVERVQKWRDAASKNEGYRAKNLARATAWKRNLDLNAPENIQRRIALRLRNRLRKALHRGPKRASAVRDLGCSLPELMERLEASFKAGMTWANYGAWHIDHIRPLASFDLTDPQQASAACHFTNLQPLWARENQKKSWKYPLALKAMQA